MIFMREFRGKKMMGYALRRCSFQVKVKSKRIRKKKMCFIYFFLIASASAFVFETDG